MKSHHERTKYDNPVPLAFESAGGSEFVQIIQAAVDKLPPSKKRSRVKHGTMNCATAMEGLLNDSVDRGASLDDVRRFKTAMNRAFDVFIRSRWPFANRAACIKLATGAETAANSHQNHDTHAVLVNGSLGDVERLHESSRIQRDMSEEVMAACSVRASELRRMRRSRRERDA